MLRQKITIAVPFAVFPPNTLASRRIFNLYRHLCDRFSIEIISLAEAGMPHFQGIIAPGLTEMRIPKSEEHQQAETTMVRELGADIADATLMKLYKLTPKYLSALKKSTQNADFVICYQPYLLPAIRAVSNKPMWYEATAIETELNQKILPENEEGIEFWESISALEKKCCHLSELIITPSQSLANDLQNKLKVNPKKIITVPNGINSQQFTFTTYEQRLANKNKLGIKDSFLAIFSGTGDPHNADQARAILNIASKLQDINFLLLGDVGIFFEPRLTPPNVRFIPSLNRKTKSIILSTADVALNPAIKGKDTQLVMLSYFCQGIPVISTPFGAQGLSINHQEHCLIGDIWRFPELLVVCQKENATAKEQRLKNLKKYVRNDFEWAEIARKFSERFQSWHLAS